MSGDTGAAIGFALLAAFIFGLGVQLSRKGLNHGDYRVGTLLTILGSFAAFVIAAPVGLPSPAWSWTGFLIFAGIGLMMPLISSHLATASTLILGPTIAATVASVSPIFGLVFGIFVFAEQLTAGIALGTGAIIIGVAVLSWRGGAQVNWPAWAIFLPIGAALIRSLSQGLTKLGFETLPSPYVAALVGYAVSSLACLVIHVSRGEPWPSLKLGSGLWWFVGAGTVNACAIFCLYYALARGDLIVVAPTVATSPVFTLLLSIYPFRQEHVDWRKLLAVGLVVPGVVLISLRTL